MIINNESSESYACDWCRPKVQVMIIALTKLCIIVLATGWLSPGCTGPTVVAVHEHASYPYLELDLGVIIELSRIAFEDELGCVLDEDLIWSIPDCHPSEYDRGDFPDSIDLSARSGFNPDSLAAAIGPVADPADSLVDVVVSQICPVRLRCDCQYVWSCTIKINTAARVQEGCQVPGASFWVVYDNRTNKLFIVDFRVEVDPIIPE